MVKNREVAIVLLKEWAEDHSLLGFAPASFYDDDADLFDAIHKHFPTLNVPQMRRKLFKVCNMLCHCGVLYGQMSGTHKEYVGEPTKQREFRWASASYPLRIVPRHGYKPMMGPDDEINFLLRHFGS